MTQHKSYWFIFLLLFILAGCSESDPQLTDPQPLGDVTAQVILLGNPLTAKYADNTPRVYARNIWDMHAHNNKIYFGGGNSSNSAPAANAGPADLWVYDINLQEFVKEYTVADEQIHRIREFDNQLYIPGHDARESWDLGNFYRLEEDGWKKYRTIPNAIHVYDIYKWGGKLFAAIGPQAPTKNIQISHDNGLTWEDAKYTSEGMSPYSSGRLYSILPLSDKLYTAAPSLPFIQTDSEDTFFMLSKSPERTAMFEGQKGSRAERAVVFDGYTVYIAGQTYNDHQYLPLALRYGKDLESIVRCDLLENTLPRDILVKENYLLVLLTKEQEDGTFYNTVILASEPSADMSEWTELFGFTTETFARSFEYLDGTFYFGLGCETESLPQATGNILKFDYEL